MRRKSFRPMGGLAAAVALALALGMPATAFAAAVSMVDSSGNVLSGDIDINDLEGHTFTLVGSGSWGEEQPQGTWVNLYDSSGNRVSGAFSFPGGHIDDPEDVFSTAITFNTGVLENGQTYEFRIEFRTAGGTKTIDTGSFTFSTASSSAGDDRPPAPGTDDGTGGGEGGGDGDNTGGGSGIGGDAESGSGDNPGTGGSGESGSGTGTGSDDSSGSGSGGGSTSGDGSFGSDTDGPGTGGGAGSGSGNTGADGSGSGAGGSEGDGSQTPGESKPGSDSSGSAGSVDDPAPSDPDGKVDGDHSSNEGADGNGSASGSHKDNVAKGDAQGTGSTHHKGDGKKDAAVAAASAKGGGGNDGTTPSATDSKTQQGSKDGADEQQKEQTASDDGTVLSELGKVYQLFNQPEKTVKQQLQQLQPSFAATGIPYALMALVAVLLLACPAGLAGRFAGYKRRLLSATRLGTNAPAAAGAPNDMTSEPSNERHDA